MFQFFNRILLLIYLWKDLSMNLTVIPIDLGFKVYDQLLNKIKKFIFIIDVP